MRFLTRLIELFFRYLVDGERSVDESAIDGVVRRKDIHIINVDQFDIGCLFLPWVCQR